MLWIVRKDSRIGEKQTGADLQSSGASVIGATKMRNTHRTRAIWIASICIAVAALAFARSGFLPIPEERIVTAHATGTFDVKVTPQPPDDKDAVPGRLLLEKQFHGDLAGSSKGQMLTAGDSTKGSAGYVAIEQVTGTLAGRSGSFALQHSGTMTHGALELSIKVVPGSGTGQLAGLAGAMTIKIEDGKHFYDFEYTLPAGH